jgi:hypothetical protein
MIHNLLIQPTGRNLTSIFCFQQIRPVLGREFGWDRVTRPGQNLNISEKPAIDHSPLLIFFWEIRNNCPEKKLGQKSRGHFLTVNIPVSRDPNFTIYRLRYD